MSDRICMSVDYSEDPPPRCDGCAHWTREPEYGGVCHLLPSDRLAAAGERCGRWIPRADEPEPPARIEVDSCDGCPFHANHCDESECQVGDVAPWDIGASSLAGDGCFLKYEEHGPSSYRFRPKSCPLPVAGLLVVPKST